MLSKRPNIPEPLKRKVLVEAGHRCAIPTCRHPTTEIAHIIPFSRCQKHEFHNLIALCPNCHKLYDREKKIDLRAIQQYKANLGLLNHRYGSFERRLIEWFSENPDHIEILLPGWHDLHLSYLLKDGMLEKMKLRSNVTVAGVPAKELYQLTEKGKQLVVDWKQGRLIE